MVRTRSGLTAAELRLGAVKAGRADLASLVEAYLARGTILDWPGSATSHYAHTRATPEGQGTPIGNMDLLIACHALAEKATLVTNNVMHFSAVPGHKIDQWSM